MIICDNYEILKYIRQALGLLDFNSNKIELMKQSSKNHSHTNFFFRQCGFIFTINKIVSWNFLLMWKVKA